MALYRPLFLVGKRDGACEPCCCKFGVREIPWVAVCGVKYHLIRDITSVSSCWLQAFSSLGSSMKINDKTYRRSNVDTVTSKNTILVLLLEDFLPKLETVLVTFEFEGPTQLWGAAVENSHFALEMKPH